MSTTEDISAVQKSNGESAGVASNGNEMENEALNENDEFDDNPMAKLLQGSSGIDGLFKPFDSGNDEEKTKEILKKGPAIMKEISGDNPVIVLTKDGENDDDNDDDDDDGGAPISLSVRQPSFSNLKGKLVMKGQTKPLLPSLDEDAQKNEQNEPVEDDNSSLKKQNVYNDKKVENDKKFEDDKNAEKENNEKDDDDDDGGAPITLGFRQPSFSNLHGQLIMKGSTVALPILAEDPIVVDSKSSERLKPKINAIREEVDEKKEEEDGFDETVHDAGEDNAPITLGFRQPSFSNLHGQLIPKGSTEALSIGEDMIIVEEGENNEKKEEKIKLDNSLKKSSEIILQSLHKFNADRWKEIGYNPDIAMKRTSTTREFDRLPFLCESSKRNVSCINYYPKIIEIPLSGENAGAKPRVHSSRGKDLKVEMPETVAKHEEDDIENEDEFAEEPIQPQEEEPRMINSAGRGRNPSQIFDILPPSMIKENEKKNETNQTQEKKYPKKTSQKKEVKNTRNYPKKQESAAQTNEQALPDKDLYLDLDDLRNEQGYDSQQGSSKIPPKLYEMITHPKESVVFLALCGVSIAGYQEKTITYVRRELKKYMDQCTKMSLIEESMYVQGILDSIKEERELMKKTCNDNHQQIDQKLDEAKNEVEKTEQFWERQNEALEAEHKVALEECDMKLEKALQNLNDEWDSEKIRNKYSKPSAKLMEMRKTAQRLISAKRFEEASILSAQIDQREAEESQLAGQKMGDDYKVAVARIEQKFANEKETINQTFEKRRAGYENEKQKQLIPINNRISRIQHEKEVAEMTKKQQEREMRAASISKKRERGSNELPKLKVANVEATKKLVLPSLNKIIRTPSSFRQKK